DCELHLIGPLQTNKVKEAIALFDVIQTVDRVKLADALADAFAKSGKHLPCFIQVNTGEEPQKAGIPPQEADAFIRYCVETLHLPVKGLMCVPPAGDNPAPHFGLLRQIAERHGLPELSMGMSGDFETAIRFGATYIRLGTALFGERQSP
ncbi:MAG: YggS family pyridoxal phosphate-dependent enzyme, partial [Rickettsiales bacterium]